MKKKKEARKDAKARSKLLTELVLMSIILVFVLIVTNFSEQNQQEITWEDEDIFNKGDSVEDSSVSVIFLVKSDCDDCTDLNGFVEGLESTGILMGNKRVVEYSSQEGQYIINRYNIDSIPTVILDSSAGDYQNIRSGWQVYGSIEEDAYVMRKISPPYYSISKQDMVGYVDVIYLTDESCEECYDPELHDMILERIDVVYGKKRHVDISTNKGKNFVDLYNIRFVPTIILSNNLGEYYNAQSIFDQYFTLEEDGFYVFRNFEEWNGITYKDFTTGELLSS